MFAALIIGGVLFLIGSAVAKDAETTTARSTAEEERLKNEQRVTHASMFTKSGVPMS